MLSAQVGFGPIVAGHAFAEPNDLTPEGRRRRLERRRLAATLDALATWLSEQSRLVAEAESATGGLRALRPAAECEPARLTRREREVACAVARGWSNRQIAYELVIAISTAERHVSNIMGKLDMRSRAQVAAWVADTGLLETGPLAARMR